MNERHISDDRLIEICVSGAAASAEQSHVAGCPACEQRQASIVQILGELDVVATLEADVAFPADRLERQQARILQRIDQDGRPGRLIAFPAAPQTTILRSRPHVRWAAAAAAAAFVMGMVAGQLVHDFSPAEERTSQQIVADDSEAVPLRAVSTTFSEDEFLGQIELAAHNGPAALRPLDAMTPRAWDIDR